MTRRWWLAARRSWDAETARPPTEPQRRRSRRPRSDGTAGTPQHPPTSSMAASAPTAVGFATIIVGTANGYAKEHGDAARFGSADCVEAAPGRYMCSYTITEPGSHPECHLMQARW